VASKRIVAERGVKARAGEHITRFRSTRTAGTTFGWVDGIGIAVASSTAAPTTAATAAATSAVTTVTTTEQAVKRRKTIGSALEGTGSGSALKTECSSGTGGRVSSTSTQSAADIVPLTPLMSSAPTGSPIPTPQPPVIEPNSEAWFEQRKSSVAYIARSGTRYLQMCFRQQERTCSRSSSHYSALGWFRIWQRWCTAAVKNCWTKL
jgi:hypothetical protein